jgi:hypothetical protein
LVGDTDPRWSAVLARLIELLRHDSRITTGSKAVNVT